MANEYIKVLQYTKRFIYDEKKQEIRFKFKWRYAPLFARAYSKIYKVSDQKYHQYDVQILDKDVSAFKRFSRHKKAYRIWARGFLR